MATPSASIPASAPEWTDPQLRAIAHGGGEVLISAAAGSGKTAVLAERCARLVCEPAEGAPACGVENLLVLTFTEAAAREMKDRIARALQEKLSLPHLDRSRRRWLLRQSAMIDRAAICTLDAFCARLLRQHFHEAQIDPAFEIMDEDEARLLREDVLDEVLARWHKLEGDAGKNFADFFEAYAQGRDATCRELILSLHHLLATTADPAAFLSAARRAYEPAGAAAVCGEFIRSTLPERLRLAEALAVRCAELAGQYAGATAMCDGFKLAAARLQEARRALASAGEKGWPSAREALDFKFPMCRAVKSIPDFESFKDATWEKVKDRFATLRDALFRDPRHFPAEMAACAGPLETLLALADDFTRAYAAAKRAENRLDFADLERLALDLLASPANLAAPELRQRYHHVLVDEFQDINPLQNALLEKLADPARFNRTGNLFAVGDVKQSIYGFRLAEPGLFLERQTRLRAIAGRNAFLTLPHNFRSRPALIAAMNGIFSRLLTPQVAGIDYADGHALRPNPHASEDPADSPTPVEVHLITTRPDQGGDSPGEDSADSRGEGPSEESPDSAPLQENLSAFDHEARMVADRIAALMQENRTVIDKGGKAHPLRYRDIAILLRTMKRRAMIFVRALARRGIPVHADLTTGFFDAPEIKDALALLHLLDNASQDVPLATTLISPFGHFSHGDLAKIRLAFDRREVPFHAAAAQYATLPAAAEPPFSPELAGRLGAFFEKLARWRESLRTQPLHEALAAIFSESKIFVYLSGLDASAQRIANLQMLCHRALAFASFRRQGLHRFLRFIERLAQEDASAGEAPVLSEASDVVRIMSVHKSKGLEFPVVFVSGLGGKNGAMAGGPVLFHRDLGIGLAVADLEADVYFPSAASERIGDAARRARCAEELRLLYVALTRARDQLILTGHLQTPAALQALRNLWRHHAGPLPEDLLLKSGPPLSWLIPALASGNGASPWPLDVIWDSPCPPGQRPHIAVTLHATSPSGSSAADARSADPGNIARLLSGEMPACPPPDVPPPDSLRAAIARISATYPHLRLAGSPAVQTVTMLKTQPFPAGEISEPDEPPPALSPDLQHILAVQNRDARAAAARDRGIATHHILELLDFSACDSPAGLDAQVQRLLGSGMLSAAEVAAADHAGIRWFLFESSAGRRITAAARRIASGNHAPRILRELPFTWTGNPEIKNQKSKIENPLADCPTIRGVMDLLLIEASAGAPPAAEILDYKTDSESTWQTNLDAYRRQMHYYLTAAGEILGFPIASATLIFLSPRREMIIELPPAVTNPRGPIR